MGLSACSSDDFNMDQWTGFGAHDEDVQANNADIYQTQFDDDDVGDAQTANIDDSNGRPDDDASKRAGDVTGDTYMVHALLRCLWNIVNRGLNAGRYF
jgi:hypothetical protein